MPKMGWMAVIDRKLWISMWKLGITLPEQLDSGKGAFPHLHK